MSRVYDEIDGHMSEFLRKQHVFFVATAPLAGDGLVNLSPKGLDTFVVVDPHRVAYLDLTWRSTGPRRTPRASTVSRAWPAQTFPETFELK